MRVTIGISPGSRYVGIAILHNLELITWRVHTFRGIWSKTKQAEITLTLQKIFASHRVEYVKIKIPDILPDTLAFSRLLGIINTLCEREELKATYYTLSQIKQQFSSNKKVTKYAIISKLVHQYPELRHTYLKEQQNYSKYYTRIFEALAAGLCTGCGKYLPK